MSNLSISERRRAALITVERLAIRPLFGLKAGILADISSDEQLDFLIPRFVDEAVEARLFESEDAAYTKIQEYDDLIGRKVPYHDSFYYTFPGQVAECGLAYIEGKLLKDCERWDEEYSFFDSDQGGYQYLWDILVDALHRKLIDTSPSVERAINWLQHKASFGQQAPLANLRQDPPAPVRTRGWSRQLFDDVAKFVRDRDPRYSARVFDTFPPTTPSDAGLVSKIMLADVAPGPASGEQPADINLTLRQVALRRFYEGLPALADDDRSKQAAATYGYNSKTSGRVLARKDGEIRDSQYRENPTPQQVTLQLKDLSQVLPYLQGEALNKANEDLTKLKGYKI